MWEIIQNWSLHCNCSKKTDRSDLFNEIVEELDPDSDFLNEIAATLEPPSEGEKSKRTVSFHPSIQVK